MSEDIKSLIEKINQEGIQQAEAKAAEIENRAKAQAKQIIERAKLEAERLMQETKKKIAQGEEREKALLAQAGRDLMLVLRQEINIMLEKLILKEVREALSTEQMFKILSNIITHASKDEKSEIVISLSKEDLHALEGALLTKLKHQAKKEVVLKPSGTLHAGFVISFDSGKSQFDFSDKALAEYIATFLKPKLKEILQG